MQECVIPSLRRFAIFAATLAAVIPGTAQQHVTAADYSRAEKSMSYNTTPLMFGSGVRPTWLPDERFWYRNTTANGSEFILVDPAKGTRQPAFDHAKLAAALSLASSSIYDATRLPFTDLEFSADGQSVTVSLGGGRRWKCDVEGKKCAVDNSPATASAGGGRGGRGGRGGG